MPSSPEINQFNQQWRSSPQYADILTRMGVDPSRPIKLSDGQRKQLQSYMEQQMGVSFPKGVEIDPAGNMNENEGFGKQAKKWGPIVAAAAVTMFGIPGTPIAGLLSGGGSAGAAGAAGAGGGGGGGLGGLYAAPSAGVSQGVSSAASGGGGGWLSTLLGGGKKALDFLGMDGRDLLGAAGSVVGAHSDSSARNRDATLGAQFDFDRLLMDREREETTRDRDFFDQGIRREEEGRAGRQDAWRKLLASERTLNPGARPQLSPYSVAPRQASERERTGADAMANEVMQRLQGGNPIQAPTRRAPLGPPSMDPRLMQPGKLESALGWLSPILNAGGALMRPQVEPRGAGPAGGVHMNRGFLNPDMYRNGGGFANAETGEVITPPRGGNRLPINPRIWDSIRF